jgi:hypothetical protein
VALTAAVLVPADALQMAHFLQEAAKIDQSTTQNNYNQLKIRNLVIYLPVTFIFRKKHSFI